MLGGILFVIFFVVAYENRNDFWLCLGYGALAVFAFSIQWYIAEMQSDLFDPNELLRKSSNDTEEPPE